MKIIADRYVPFLSKTIREGWPEVELVQLEPADITAETVRDADALIIRTRTHVNGELLEGSRVRLVCTATIGYDHIDQDYCRKAGIRWISCPGCNAQAVADYVEEAIDTYFGEKGRFQRADLAGKFIGIVGLGNVGKRVQQMAERRGMQVMVNDAPLGIGDSLSRIAETCDILTFHTPITRDGQWPTYHLCNAELLGRCHPGTLIINAARGGVVDEQALLHSGLPYILDTWENEPQPDRKVLAEAKQASMHIAGYSVEGKKNASEMCLRAISEEFGLKILSIDKKIVSLQSQKGDHAAGWLQRITNELKQHPEQFEQLRKNYKLR